MASRGTSEIRGRGIAVSSRRGWGPGASKRSRRLRPWSRGQANPRRGIAVQFAAGVGPAQVKEAGACGHAERGRVNPSEASASVRAGVGPGASKRSWRCGHAEPRTGESEARHQRQFAPGVGPGASKNELARTESFPGSLDTLTGGYGYDRRMVAGLVARGWSVVVRELDGSFPLPTSARAEPRRPCARAVAGDTPCLSMDSRWGLSQRNRTRNARLRLVWVVHHPLAAETGTRRSHGRPLEASERRALASVRLVI